MYTQGMIPAKENASKKISDRYQKKVYVKGATCIYGDTLYRAKADITTAEEWNAAHWEETNMETIRAEMAAELRSLNANKAEFYYHKHIVDAIANQAIEIPGTTGYYNVIPVIMGMSSVRDAQVTIEQDSGKWWIVSSVSQRYTLFFWELKSFIG